MIKLTHINKTYGGQSKAVAYHIFKDIDLTIHDGDFVAIIGPSGSGKSTLLNILGLLDQDYTGGYELDGEHVNQLADEVVSKYRNQKVGFVFQSFKLLPGYTVKENIQIPLLYAGDSGAKMDRVQELLELVGLADKLNELPQNLSGGQQQRISIVRALINDPDIIIADEPTGALDSETTAMVLKILMQINEAGKTIIMVTHSKDAATVATRQIKIVDGVLYEM